MTPISKAVKNIQASVRKASADQPKTSALYVPTGSTLLNLALSDHWNGGYGLGKMYNVIGDSSAGKTVLALSCFAEAANRKRFDEYDLIYDDAEFACEFNIPRLFGQRTADRIIAPRYDENNQAIYSRTVQAFHANIVKRTKKGKPFIYVLDSFDALDSLEGLERAEAMAKAVEAGTEVKGSYKTEKARILGELLRQMVGMIERTESLLLIISQTRDNLNPMSYEKKIRSGGKALRFYATGEYWMAVMKKLKANDRQIGVMASAAVRKNKLTGKLRDVEFPIYYDLGVDDVDSCIDFLLKEGWWKQDGLKIKAEGLGVTAVQRKLIEHIEAGGLESKLRQITGECWQAAEDKVLLHRKPRWS